MRGLFAPLRHFPFLSLGSALVIARIATAIFFMAHAVGRIVLGSIPQFGQFMEGRGFPHGEIWVWIITAAELTCGTLLILNKYVRLATVPLLIIVIGGIILIHWNFGWFVGEHGTGGSEYSFALIILLLVVAAHDRKGAD